jgi:Flp pilus assembly protein TadD
VVVGLALALPACTSWRGAAGAAAIDVDDLLTGAVPAASGAAPAPLVEEKQVLAVSLEMRAFLDAHVGRDSGDSLKMHRLAAAITGRDTFGLVYDDRTRTASETFSARRGNCLSFATMFVAMARAVGLTVQFQEVEIPPDWRVENDTYVLNRHVNVFVDLGAAGTRVVDFNIADFRASYEMRRISDARALAHYYNNVGVERMLAGGTAEALSSFRRAIAGGDRRFSPAWTNLGTLYLRLGQSVHAEAAYLQALRTDGGDLVALSNLARLRERLGDEKGAARYRRAVVYHRNRNPYYRYELARRAYDEGHYDAAIDHLTFATRARPSEDRFCHLLGMSFLRQGNGRAARRWLERAEEVAATDALKRRYMTKIDALARQDDSL